MFGNKKLMGLVTLLVIAITILSACAPATPQVVEKEVVVEKPVVQTVVVEKEKVVEKPVVETVVVEKEVEVMVTPTPVPEVKPVPGGTLIYVIESEPDMLDPVLTGYWHFAHTASHIYDALLCSDEKGNLYPALAESWEISDDGLHYTFHLRKGVKFHDGTPFNAEAVKFHLDRVKKDPEWCCFNAYEYVGPYESSEVLDEYTVRVNFKEPWGPFLTYAADWYTMSIVSPAAVKKWGKDILMHPVGTGPFRFVEWVPQSHVTLERNPDYNWAPEIRGHQGPPYLDKIVIKFISEPSTRLACLKSGECDVIRGPAFPDIKGIRADPNFEVVKIPQKGSPLSWNFNTVRPPTDDLQVRKALNFAVDRQRIAEMIFANERAPMYTALSPETPEYWPGAADYIRYDPEEAKAILEKVGWVDTNGDGFREKGGQRLAIDFYVFGAAEANPYVMLAELVQADLKEVGYDVKINVRPWDDQSIVAMKKEHHLIQYSMPHINATVLGVLFHSRETPSEGHYGMGFTWFHEANPTESKKLDDLLGEADVTSGFEQRKLIYWEAQKIIAENYLGMPISLGFEIHARSKKVHDVTYNGAQVPTFYDTWIER